jgi:peptide/nickel transport system permease protein
MSQATAATVEGAALVREPPGRIAGVALSVGRFVRRRPLGAFGGLIIVLLVMMALFAPAIAPYSYDHQVLSERLQDPSRAHLLGTDNLGRDTFQRVIDIWIALPGIVAIVFMVAILGPSLRNITLLLGVLGSAGASRVVRGAVLGMRHSQYMEAAQVMGASDLRIMLRYVLPNVTHVIVVGATVAIGGFILVEAGLAFLGLGVPPPFPTWGRMLNVSREYLNEPWLAIGPGIALTAAVFSFNVFGDALRDVMDPRMRGT